MVFLLYILKIQKIRKNIIKKNCVTFLEINKVLKSNLYYDKYYANVFQIEKNQTIGNILLQIKKDVSKKKLKIGYKIIVTTDFLKIKPPLYSTQFNYKKYLEKKDIYQQIYTQYNKIKLLNDQSTSIFKISENIRTKIQKKLKYYFHNNDEFSIINALLLGDKKNISKTIKDNYSNAGVIHILAISGLHIGIILLFLTWLLKPLKTIKYGQTIKILILILLLWFYAFIIGLSPSVVRSVTMFSILSIGISLEKNII